MYLLVMCVILQLRRHHCIPLEILLYPLLDNVNQLKSTGHDLERVATDGDNYVSNYLWIILVCMVGEVFQV